MNPASSRAGETAGSISTLFLAAGTLVCCALPLLLVTLGFGSAVAALTSAAPWLVALSAHKGWIFLGSGLAIAFALGLLYRPGRACPTDPALARACARADRWNRVLIWSAVTIWAVGAFAAFAWLPILQWWETAT